MQQRQVKIWVCPVVGAVCGWRVGDLINSSTPRSALLGVALPDWVLVEIACMLVTCNMHAQPGRACRVGE
jgi:hypothetical protein